MHVVGNVAKPQLARWLQKTYVSSVKTSISRGGPTPTEEARLIEDAHYHAVEQWRYVLDAVDDFKRLLRAKPTQ